MPVSNCPSLPRTQHGITVQGEIFTGPIQYCLLNWVHDAVSSLKLKLYLNKRVRRPIFKQILNKKKWGGASPVEQIFIYWKDTVSKSSRKRVCDYLVLT